MTIFWAIAALLLVLTPVVFVHELGHFIAAKLCGIRVEEFGLGLPPRATTLFTKGGTVFSLNWIPLGGFVRPSGENDPNVSGGLAAARPLQRLFVLAAGALANFAFALFVLWFAFWLGPTATRITAVYPDSPALVGGLQTGDIFLEINGVKVDSARVMADQLHQANGRPLDILVQRGAERVLLHIIPNTPEAAKATGTLVLGVEVEQTTAHGYLRRSPGEAASEAADYVRSLISSTAAAPAQLARGELSAEEARPVSIVGISQLAGRATANTFITGSLFPLLLMTGLLSTALGFTQLLPIPALDGGRILFVLVEMISGRRVTAERETAVHRAGMMVLLLLMVILIVQDLITPILR